MDTTFDYPIMRVPFVDLKAQYHSLQAEFEAAILKVLSDTAFIAGRYTAEFERAFAEYLGVSHCIGVANGTDALEIALLSVGIEPGDEVLVPANTFFATAEAVTNIGAVPIFVDVDPATYNIDTSLIEAAITPRTKAIIPVHLYGLPADIEDVVDTAREHDLKVVEDCAQAHGATVKGRKVGTFGDAATFSFYPSKNLGAFGDGGAIVTNNDDVNALARAISNHGQLIRNSHSMIGRNSRLDGIQGAVLSVKLPHLESWIGARRSHAARYNELLSGTGLILPVEPRDLRHTYHLYVVQVSDRDAVQARLANSEIETGIHYPTAIPFLEPFNDRGYTSADFPVAYAQMSKLLSLPMYAELTDEMIERVCEVLRTAVAGSAGANA
jgi:dTDP-4-amino-4,6-dideoxygalactose transaminase